MANLKDPSHLEGAGARAPTQGASMKKILITGATRGLGLAIAEALAATGACDLVLAVRDVEAGEAVARRLSGGARVLELDVGSADSIARLTRAWSEPLDALVNNAGLQLTGPLTTTERSTETTFEVNHLGPLQLTLGLLPWLRGGTVLGIGSGTHNPHNVTARIFGFRGARFTTVESAARGESDGRSDRQRGMDRYATSKLLSMVTTMELARRYPETRFVTLDPGLMPGTGLARTAPRLAQLGWNALRWLVPLIPDASTPERSARAARALLLSDAPISGEVYDFTGRPSRRVWERARDPSLARSVLDEWRCWRATRRRSRRSDRSPGPAGRSQAPPWCPQTTRGGTARRPRARPASEWRCGRCPRP
jgi:NAD(P)-dependent dehydrogenase (short-subunit alcohol dehydrogenase family)